MNSGVSFGRSLLRLPEIVENPAASSTAPLAERLFDVLRCVVREDRPVALETVSAATGLPKTTAHRILLMLVAAGMLQRENGAKAYGVGPRLTSLALDVLVHSSLRGGRHAVLQALVDQIGETCNFTMRDGNEVVYIDRVESHWPLRLNLQPGSRVPLHCTSSGKLYLSQMTPRQRRLLLTAVPLKRYTDKTITDPQTLERELAKIAKEGVATDDEGFLAGLISVAVPVKSETGRVIGTVAVHAPNARLSLERAREYVPLLRKAAEALGGTY